MTDDSKAMAGFVAGAAGRGAQSRIRHVAVVPRGAARGLVARVYAQVERDFGMLAPPVALHAPVPDVLAAVWIILRETLIATGAASRAEKEAVATVVSRGNTCPYCVDVHGTALRDLAEQGGDAALLAADRIETVGDGRLREIAAWARSTGTPEAAGRQPPGTPAQARELLGVAVTFHYLNRMVNVFLGGSPFPPAMPDAARGAMLRLLGRMMRPATGREHEPGGSLDLLAPGALPADLSWAAETGHVAAGLARAAAAIEAAGHRSVPAAARDLVLATLAAWDGRPPGPGRSWADAAVRGLAAADRPAARLALMTALASYQVDEAVIRPFRADRPDDAALIGVTAWASLAAARRVAAWTPIAAGEPGAPRHSARSPRDL